MNDIQNEEAMQDEIRDIDWLEKRVEELENERKWKTPSQRPEYKPDDNSFSVIVFARWGKDGETSAEIWFDFKEDMWMWDAKSDPITFYGDDFKWIDRPKLNEEKPAKENR